MSVEGGIAFDFSVGDVQVVIVDWDVVDETTSIEEIENYIEQVEQLPDDLPSQTIDKVGILKQLNRALKNLKERTQ